MINNFAFRGGGAAISDTADMTVAASYVNGFLLSFAGNCWSFDACNQIVENLASEDNGYGGGFMVDTGGTLDISRSHITGNRADFGTGVYIIDADSLVEMEGNLIANNGAAAADGYTDGYAIRAYEGAALVADYLTIADNAAVFGSIGNFQSSVTLYSSIIHDSNGIDAYDESNPVATNMDCIIANEVASLPSLFTIIEDNPDFVDRNNGDFHINAQTSPAVDYCDTLRADEDYYDIDNEERGWDDYVAGNNIGPFDIGFDETYENDVIFKHNIED